MGKPTDSEGKSRILVVENNAADLQFLVKILQEQGHMVTPAPEGRWSMAVAESAAPDLILLNVDTPGVDAHEVCEQLKAGKNTRGVPVIFASGAGQPREKIAAFFKDGADYVLKPYHAEELLARIGPYLSLRKLQKGLAARAEPRTAERLQELDRARDSFLSTVAHELRAPLSSICGLAEILHADPKMRLEQRTKFVGVIIEETKRLTKLIDQALDAAKIDSGNAEWRITEFDLGALIEDAVAAADQFLIENLIALTIETPEKVPLISADRDRLMLVMLDLISNAAKFCDKSDGRVTIALTQEGEALRVSVTDNGPGIRPEDHESIFEKFRQDGDSSVDKLQGAGLGLPISRKIVNQFGGRLWVESEPGQGTTFSFTLPLQ